MNHDEIKLWGDSGQIQNIIGLELTIKLMLAYTTRRPGNGWRRCRIYVPTPAHLTPSHQLAQAIGLDAARRMSNAFGGETLEPPSAKHVILDRRNHLIALMAPLFTSEEIAETLTLTPRQIRKITEVYT